MKIMSWNVNSVRVRHDRLLALLDRHAPDVLCLQELKCTEAELPRAELERRGYHVHISGQKSWNGVAILAREPLTDVEIDLPWRGDAQARGISARVGGVRIVNLYVVNGQDTQSDKYPYKLEWLACLQRYLAAQEQQGDPLCMLGDFNIGPDARDLPDPARQTGGIMASDAERQALADCLGERLSDAFRLFEPAGGHWSWWDYRSGAWERDQGWRIDHIYLCEQLLGCATGCVIDRTPRGNLQPSDHAPVVVNLAWPPQEDDEDEAC